MHISMHHLSLYLETTAQITEVEFGGKYVYMRANMDIGGQIRILEGKYGYLPRICPWQITNTDVQLLLDMQNEHIATKYVIMHIIILRVMYNIQQTLTIRTTLI